MKEKPSIRLNFHLLEGEGGPNVILSFRDTKNNYHANSKPALYDLTGGWRWWYFRGLYSEFGSSAQHRGLEFAEEFFAWKKVNKLYYAIKTLAELEHWSEDKLIQFFNDFGAWKRLNKCNE